MVERQGELEVREKKTKKLLKKLHDIEEKEGA
jgi:hypothetical protein